MFFYIYIPYRENIRCIWNKCFPNNIFYIIIKNFFNKLMNIIFLYFLKCLPLLSAHLIFMSSIFSTNTISIFFPILKFLLLVYCFYYIFAFFTQKHTRYFIVTHTDFLMHVMSIYPTLRWSVATGNPPYSFTKSSTLRIYDLRVEGCQLQCTLVRWRCNNGWFSLLNPSL